MEGLKADRASVDENDGVTNEGTKESSITSSGHNEVYKKLNT